MNIQVIAQGSTKVERFFRRWGISFLVGEEVLFDTFGDPRVFMRNVRNMHIDLAAIRHVVISHDHWDHIAGLWEVLKRPTSVTVYLCAQSHPDLLRRVRMFGVRVIEITKPHMITEKVYSLGQMAGMLGAERVAEQALVVRTAKGLVLVVGCSHPGIVSIVEEAIRQFKEPIACIIGGLHLKDSSAAEINQVVSALQKLGVHTIAPAHCTGEKALCICRAAFQNNFLSVAERTQFTF